ncbi:MAG: transposase family protein [Aggregatilineales bacterium]
MYKLMDIITITVCAMINGAETRMDITDFCEDKVEWLEGFLELAEGIPSLT